MYHSHAPVVLVKIARTMHVVFCAGPPPLKCMKHGSASGKWEVTESKVSSTGAAVVLCLLRSYALRCPGWLVVTALSGAFEPG